MQEVLSTISPYFRTFQRKFLLIASLTSFTTLIALWFSLKDPNTYVSSFRLLLEPSNSTAKLSQASTLARTEGLPDEDFLNLDYPTQLEILKSPLILSKIANQVKQKLPEVEEIDDSIRDNLTVERITIGPSRYDWTKIFEITYKETDPQIVQTVAEATAQQYLKYSLEERQNSLNAGVKFIDEQLPELKQRVADLQSKQQQLQQQHHLIDPSQRGQELFDRVDDLNKQILDNNNQLSELETLAMTLQEQLNLTPQQAVATLALNQNPNYRELLRELQTVEGKIASISARFTNESPQLIILQQDKHNLLQTLQQKTELILQQHGISLDEKDVVLNFQNESFLKLAQQLVDTHNQIKVLRIRDRSLRKTKQTMEKPAEKLPAIARQYEELEQELDLTNQILNQLLTQRETLRVEAAQKDVPWKLLGKAEVIRDSDGLPMAFPPDRTQKLALGVMGGMALGVGTALLWERWRDIFYTAQDIQDVLFLPLLGQIPRDDRFNFLPVVSSSSSALALIKTNSNEENQKSLFLSSFVSLYAELTFLYADNPINSLVISSVEPKDGQSTIAIELAKTAATEGKKVLLVDANLNRAQSYTQLNLVQPGEQNWVSSDGFLREKVVCRVPGVNNLSVVTARILQEQYLNLQSERSAPDKTPSNKLWSTQMEETMKEWAADYDFVIYDAPHFLDTPDVSFLTAQTDGIVLVVGVKKTRQSLVKEAINQISAFRLPTLGIVANHCG